MRLIDPWLMPISVAIERVDQCVASVGFSSRVFTMTASTMSSVMVAPGTGARLVEQPVGSLFEEPSAPLAHRAGGESQFRRDRAVGAALGRAQHDAGTLRERLSGLRPPHPARQRVAVLPAQRQLRQWTAPGHGIPPSRTTMRDASIISLTYESVH